MRYRPFGRAGVSVSAVTLTLDDQLMKRGPDGVRSLIYGALEAGINTYQVESVDPELPALLGECLGAVERRLVFVSLRLGLTKGRTGLTRDFSPETVTATVEHMVETSGLGHIDLALLDDPSAEELPQRSLEALKGLRTTGQVSLLGVAGANDAMDAYLSTNAFDVLSTPYHLRSSSKERSRLKSAASLDMGVVAYGYFPEAFASPGRLMAGLQAAAAPIRRGLFGGRAAAPAAAVPQTGMGTYGFLHNTKNWTAEEICLGYALMEPTVSTVLIRADNLERLGQLAGVPDRDLPAGLAAQVEMARFAPEP